MKLDHAQAQTLLNHVQGKPVAVLGDLMLDEYLFGEVNRISPEAPVPVVRVVREHAVLGGAANVAANLQAIGATPLLVGAVGDDAAGARLTALLESQRISSKGVVKASGWPTIIKTRIIGQQQQMLRIDREEPEAGPSSAFEALLRHLDEALASAKALIVSDYAKGLLDARLLTFVRQRCAQAKIPWIVDPKPSHRALYQGATLMTPNTKELAELTGLPAKTDEDMTAAARKLVGDLELQGLLVTRSEKGMALLAPEARHEAPWWIPTEAREVFDVSGAGDTVIATFAAAVAAGADWKDAAMLANAAAGVVVGKMGTATVTPEELLDRYRAQEAR